MRSAVALAFISAALAACAAAAPGPSPSPTGCPEPPRRTGIAAFDEENRATFQKELAEAGCETATKAYVTRLEEKIGERLLANASTFAIYGRVTDEATGAPIANVCVTAGPRGSMCWGQTDVDGWYLVDLGAVQARQGFFEFFFVKDGYPEQHWTSRMLSGRARVDYQMKK